jgi:hypothetical protein
MIVQEGQLCRGSLVENFKINSIAEELIALVAVHTQAFLACSLVYAELYLGSNPSSFELKHAD